MRYAKINTCDLINVKSGVAVSFWLQGCPHACDGCFNKETWDSTNGKHFDMDARKDLFNALSESYVTTFSVLGGEPLAPYHREEVLNLINEIKFIFPEITIMVWTGYTLDEIIYSDIKSIDYIIDGKFVKELSDKNLKLRGSSNQKVWKNVNGKFGEVVNI